jgi:hypothetical protein
MIDFTDESTFRAYFEGLASGHVDINEFIYGDEQAAQNARSGSAGPFILWLDYYPPIQGRGEHDNYVGEVIANFTIMSPSSTRNSTPEEKQNIYNACEAIVRQVIAKVLKDYRESITSYGNHVERFKLGQLDDITHGSTTYVGCGCELVFVVPQDFDYDETKWTN